MIGRGMVLCVGLVQKCSGAVGGWVITVVAAQRAQAPATVEGLMKPR